MTNNIKCIGCNSTDVSIVSNGFFCRNCELKFDFPKNKYDYDSEYMNNDSLYASHLKLLEYFQSCKLDKLYYKLLPYESHILKLLSLRKDLVSLVDLGCGIGRFLRAAESKHIQAHGYEVVNILVKTLKDFGRNVNSGGIEEFLSDDSNMPDVITLLEVLEHLQEPGKDILRIIDIKSPKLLCVVVPEWSTRRVFDRRFADHDKPPNHLTWWNEKSLIKIMQYKGYVVKVIEIQESRRSLLGHFIRNGSRRLEKIGLMDWIKGLYNEPNFWLLAVAEKIK